MKTKKLRLLWARDRIDVAVAIAGTLLGVVISSMNLIYSNAYLITLGPILIIVCLLYLIFRRKLLTPQPDSQASHSFILIINIIFWLSLAGSIYSLSTEILHRPLTYFILISLCASMIALQILYSRGRGTIYLILFEILLLSLSVRASAFFVFPTLPGSDPWAHIEYIRAFVTQGAIPQSMPAPMSQEYLHLPIMHLSAASMKLITGVDYKMAMFLSTGLPLMLSTIFVFLIGRNLANTKIGLLAALLLSLADFHLEWGIQITPMSLGIALFTIIIYLLIWNKGYARASISALAILLMLVLIMTHTVAAFVMFCFVLFFLIAMYAYRFLYRERGTQEGKTMVTPGLLGMYGVAMLAYWTYVATAGGESFFAGMTHWLYRSVTTQAAFLITRPVEAIGLSQILNILGFLLLVLWGILGSLLWLSGKPPGKTKMGFIVTLILLLAIPFSFSAFGLRNVLPNRWFAFTYTILSVVAAVGIFAIIYHIHYHKLRNIILLCIALATSFFMITNSLSNTDSPVYAPELNTPLVYTNSELVMAETIVEVYDGKIIADLQYGQCILGIHLGRGDVSCAMLSEEALNSGLVIWRDVMAERPVGVFTGTETIKWYSGTVVGEAFEQELENSHSLVYTNNTGRAYLARGL